jgi:RNA polymerase sigma factor (sigma-70 family)
MRSALAGDQGAYRQLLSAIIPYVRAVARRSLNAGSGAADIEDVVQETLLAVHLKRGTWDTTRAFTPWLSAVVRHKAIDALRRKGGRVELAIEGFEETLAAPHDDGDIGLDVETALSVLDQRQRTIVEQISLQGRSAAEVGAALGMTESAVRVALHRAVKSLAKTFDSKSVSGPIS